MTFRRRQALNVERKWCPSCSLALSEHDGGRIIEFFVHPIRSLTHYMVPLVRALLMRPAGVFRLNIPFFLFWVTAFAAAIPAQPALSANTSKSDVVCPSKDFEGFLSVFSEHAPTQRRYTRLPLQYGEYADLVGSRIKWRRIRRIEAVPQFNPDTRLVIRSRSEREEKHLALKIEGGDGERLREAAVLFEGGGDVRYYFALMPDCWYLYAIKNAF